MSFNNIRNNVTRCAKIVNASRFDVDLDGGRLPQYSYFTPNIDNDGHNTNITYAGKWLHSFLSPRLSKLPHGALVVLTWDEDDHTENNQIFTVLIGSMITPASQDHTFYNHYSLLKTVEDNWNLGNLHRKDISSTTFFD
eukprot:TRINITY_DN17236_c0_g1_i1.p1 TRINITY_DN17236_c0_g1~~TRINITY_DN17236_c0_g1_i1.p1  ORF type:complete len:157 (-),score=18.96 TRINITY_DN17236_c0_g1_i1:203-619(-)